MKKLWKTLLLAGVLAVLMGVTVLAAPVTPTEGIYNLQVSNGATMTLTAMDAEKNEITTTTEMGGNQVYAGAVQVRFTCKAQGNFALILTLDNANGRATESTIKYINQDSIASDGTVTFYVYPSELKPGTYSIYLTTDGPTETTGLHAIASFDYYVSYTLGDVDENGEVDMLDALVILDDQVGKVELTGNAWLAADINGDGEVDMLDALIILDYLVGKPTVLG